MSDTDLFHFEVEYPVVRFGGPVRGTIVSRRRRRRHRCSDQRTSTWGTQVPTVARRSAMGDTQFSAAVYAFTLPSAIDNCDRRLRYINSKLMTTQFYFPVWWPEIVLPLAYASIRVFHFVSFSARKVMFSSALAS